MNVEETLNHVDRFHMCLLNKNGQGLKKKKNYIAFPWLDLEKKAFAASVIKVDSCLHSNTIHYRKYLQPKLKFGLLLKVVYDICKILIKT